MTRPPRQRRKQLGFQFRTWGGKRKGAGRKPLGAKAGVPHRPRPELSRRMPLHVTLRMAPHVYNLRSRRSFAIITKALQHGATRFEVGVVRFSVQGNHIHLLVEAASRVALGRALKGLSVRIARGMNKLMGGRRGRVLHDRYHAHVLRTPTEVRAAANYVRHNQRKHAAERGEMISASYVDPYSSDARTPGLVLPSPRTWPLREDSREGTVP
jgi:putative transposase